MSLPQPLAAHAQVGFDPVTRSLLVKPAASSEGYARSLWRRGHAALAAAAASGRYWAGPPDVWAHGAGRRDIARGEAVPMGGCGSSSATPITGSWRATACRLRLSLLTDGLSRFWVSRSATNRDRPSGFCRRHSGSWLVRGWHSRSICLSIDGALKRGAIQHRVPQSSSSTRRAKSLALMPSDRLDDYAAVPHRF